MTHRLLLFLAFFFLFGTSSFAEPPTTLGRGRISVQFRETSIREVLKQFADLRRESIVFHPDVTGQITMSLTDVPVEQAFDLVLRQGGLRAERNGNVVMIYPLNYRHPVP